MFKKRNTPKGALRKSRAIEDDDAENESEQIELIREIREEQKDRRRAPGLEARKLISASEKATQEKERKLAEEATGIRKEAAGPDLKALISNQFTEQVGGAQNEDEVHEKRLEAFIDEQMGVTKESEEEVKQISEEDKLYQIADVVKGDSDQTSEGITGNAAPLFMGAGIAEIALPMEFRMRNIERTEDAKMMLHAKRDGTFMRRDRAPANRLERGGGRNNQGADDHADLGGVGSGRYGGSAAMSGGSFNSNFNTHRREWAVMMKEKDKQGGSTEFGGKGRGGDGGFEGTCNVCGKSGHRARDCTSSSGGSAISGGGSSGKGFKGGKGGKVEFVPTGHSASSDDRCFEQYKKRARR